jgi:hypothetical protein
MDAGGCASRSRTSRAAATLRALNHITTSPADALVPRTLMQLVFLAATVAVLAASVRSRRFRRRSAVTADGAQS